MTVAEGENNRVLECKLKARWREVRLGAEVTTHFPSGPSTCNDTTVADVSHSVPVCHKRGEEHE